MSMDVTAGAGEAYAACKTLYEDLNRLATDFCQAIRDIGVQLPKDEEYSYSPHELSMKHDHIWVAHRIDIDKQFSLAAAYVIFERGKNHVKVGAPGRPEVWYMLGRATLPMINLADGVRSLFMKSEMPLFKPPLAVGGTVSFYEFKDPTMDWSVVSIGFELGDVDSPQALKQKVVNPLLQAVNERTINL
jgi:hypothetical protein